MASVVHYGTKKTQYDRSELYRLRNTNTRLHNEVFETITSLGIKRTRGCRAGVNIKKQIRVISMPRNDISRLHDELRPKTLVYPQPVDRKTCTPSAILVNARSLNNKIDDLELTLHSLYKNTPLVAVTETWFSLEKPATACQLTGYKQFHRDRGIRLGGGVCLYVRDDLNVTEVFADQVPACLEVMWIRLTSSKRFPLAKSIIIGVVYSPPRSNFQEQLNDHLIDMIDSIRLRSINTSVVIMGDFNDFDSTNFEQNTSLKQIVTLPTRGNAILDKIFTDVPELFSVPRTSAPIARSDHRVVHLLPTDGLPQATSRTISYRPFRESAIRSFGQWITQMDWVELQSMESENWVSWFQHLLLDQYRQHFASVSLQRKTKDKSWMNDHLRRLIHRRDESHSRGEIQVYNRLRNLIQREIESAKQLFYKRKVEHLKVTDPAKWHKQIRSLTGMRKKSAFLPDSDKSPPELAHELNSYFSSICTQLPPLDLSALPSYLPADSPPLIDRVDVYNRLRQIDVSKASHPNDPPLRLVKEFAYEISGPLTEIFNDCLRRGHFPTDWKSASVSPIPKTTPATDFTHLRPISITPIFARIFESFLADWVMADIRSLIDPQQFGNMRGSSVNHYLVSLLDVIHRGLDKPGNHVNLCTFDFTKAFDLIDHTLAIKKLIGLGVNSAIIPTICSFLSARSQTVRYNGVESTPLHLTCGVPQGTKLGPIIFLAMVNDAALVTELRWKYVDDLSFVEIVPKSQQSSMQEHVDSLSQWCDDNSMTPKPEKCKLMQISFLRNGPPPPVLVSLQHQRSENVFS